MWVWIVSVNPHISFVECISNKIEDRVFNTIDTNGITLPTHVREQIRPAFNVGDVFNGLNTRSQRESFYRNQLHYLAIKLFTSYMLSIILYVFRNLHLLYFILVQNGMDKC